VALGVPVRLRRRIFSTFGITRVMGRQPNAPAAFTPEEMPGTHFQRLSRPQGTWFCRKETRKISPVVPSGIDPGTVRLVVQRLNHYATPGAGPICQCFSNIVRPRPGKLFFFIRRGPRPVPTNLLVNIFPICLSSYIKLTKLN
jgi:hypothetical protein